MQSAAYGKYKNGKIYFDDPAPAISESKVIVVFLDKGWAVNLNATFYRLNVK